MKLIFTTICSLIISTIIAQTQINLLGQKTYPNDLSDVWGYKDTMGFEYALVGVRNGFSIVDITDGQNLFEVYFLLGPSSTWRDIKVWNHHAYITNENTGGLLIVDLSKLPTPSFTYNNFLGSNYSFSSAHNIYIDENGFAYIFGANRGNGGAIILDLNSNPKNPVEVGIFDEFYLHDGYVKNDTLWGSAVYEGLQVMIDVSNKANPQILTSFETPGKFAHNCWPSDNSDYVFTTDEIPSGTIGSFDVRDFENPILVDNFKVSSLKKPIPHNTFFKNNYLITSYYSEGLHVLDATKPESLIEIGKYDTSPDYEEGFNGAWGVYPYFSSDKIAIADIQNGLFVFQPNFSRGCYLEGIVYDSLTGVPLENISVSISASRFYQSRAFGKYNAGIKNQGTYDVTFSGSGYFTKVYNNIDFVTAQTTTLNAYLRPTNPPAVGLQNKIEENNTNYAVYPNPVGEVLQLTNPLTKGNTLQLLSGSAKMVFESNQQTEKFYLPNNITKGWYLMQIVNSQGKIVFKQMVVKR